MKGYNVFYPFGFDDNGLPTERLVEKQIGKKANQLSREEFTKLCLETTAKYEEQFKELFKSLGFSADWDYMYSTMGEKAQMWQIRPESYDDRSSYLAACKKSGVYVRDALSLS